MGYLFSWIFEYWNYIVLGLDLNFIILMDLVFKEVFLVLLKFGW